MHIDESCVPLHRYIPPKDLDLRYEMTTTLVNDQINTIELTYCSNLAGHKNISKLKKIFLLPFAIPDPEKMFFDSLLNPVD